MFKFVLKLFDRNDFDVEYASGGFCGRAAIVAAIPIAFGGFAQLLLELSFFQWEDRGAAGQLKSIK
jgi:hypothetical protein